MANRVDGIYLKSTGAPSPSKSLEDYLGEYAVIFPITDCANKDNENTCKEELTKFIENDNLLLNDRPSKQIGYPVVVKGETAYITPSIGAFEELLGCGSLK